MPKERTHWHIARRVHEEMADVPLRRIIGRCPNLYFLGAVLPDSPLYALRARLAGGFFRLLDRRIHDPVQGVALVRDSFRTRPAAKDDAAVALGLGVLTHLAADAVVHPAIDAVAAQDLARHFELETRLDLILVADQQGRRRTVGRLVRRGGVSRRALYGLVAGLFRCPDRTGLCAWMLACHAVLQGLFHRRPAYRAAVSLQRCGLPGMATYRRLFYHDVVSRGPHVPAPDSRELEAAVRCVGQAVAVCRRLFEEGGDVPGLCRRLTERGLAG